MRVGRLLPEPGDNMRCLLEFLFGQPDFAHEAMQMLDQRSDDLAHARVGDLAISLEYRWGDGVLIVDDHVRTITRTEVWRKRRGNWLPEQGSNLRQSD